jgi:tetratricopeptide (TPR) repeat protein
LFQLPVFRLPAGPVRALRLIPAVLTLALAAAAFAQEPGAAPAADPCAEGRELYRAGRALEARAALLQCLEVGGPQVETLLPLTVIAVRAGNVDEALDFGARAASLAPDDPETRYWHGRALLRAGRTDEARAEWEAGLQLTFDHPGILEGLARLALQEGQAAKAYNLLTQLQRQGVDDAWLYGLLAEIAASRGLWDQALANLEQAMARQTPGAEQLISASEMSILAGRHDQSVAYCRRAVALAPGGRTYGALGEAFFAAESMDSALVWLRRAVDDPAAPPRARFNLANALEVVGLGLEAGDQFRLFLAAMPQDAMGHFNYGIHLERMDRPEEGLAEGWDEALAVVGSLGSRDPDASRELLAWEQRLRDRRDGADGKLEAGLVHLLHMVLGSPEQVDRVQAELEAGADFAELTVRLSQGPAAAKGGDIGWIDPAQMAEPLRSAVAGLQPNEISPPVEARGLYHIFKRIR